MQTPDNQGAEAPKPAEEGSKEDYQGLMESAQADPEANRAPNTRETQAAAEDANHLKDKAKELEQLRENMQRATRSTGMSPIQVLVDDSRYKRVESTRTKADEVIQSGKPRPWYKRLLG